VAFTFDAVLQIFSDEPYAIPENNERSQSMKPANSYIGVCRALGDRFFSYKRNDVNITGLIFGIPDTPLGKAEYLPIIDYWHRRSDNVTDFFCGGFFEADEITPPPDSMPVAEIRHSPGRPWYFSSQMLADFVDEIAKKSSWTPSNEFDVILCTARHEKDERLASLDFTSAVCITLEEAKKVEAIRNLSNLLTMVFEFAKSINEDTRDAAWEFSDKRGILVLKQTLRAMLESWIPKWLSKGGKKAEIFAVHDITPA
jgi:hypothetical protein